MNTSNWKPVFFTIWTGQAFSLLGSQLVQFALVWWLTQKTESGTVLSTALLVGLLPQVFLGPFAGALVDRWNRRLTMIVADGLVAMGVVALAILFWLGVIQVWHVYLLMFLRSLAGAFHFTSMQASISLMVPHKHLSRVQGMNEMLRGAMNIGAAPLGALLLSLIPMYAILSIDIATAAIAIISLVLVAIPQPEKIPAGQAVAGKPSLLTELKEGLQYVLGWPGLLLIILTSVLINFLFAPASALLPLLVLKHFSGEAAHLAGLQAAMGIGVVAGGLVLGVWGGFHNRILTTFAALILLGMSFIVIGLVPAAGFLIAAGMMFLAGFALPMVNGPVMAVFQAVVAPQLQGRVFTLVGSLAAGAAPLGLLIAGPLSDVLSVQLWYLAGGVVTLLTGVISFFIPILVNLEADRGENTPKIRLAEEISDHGAGI